MQIPILNGIYTDEASEFRTSYPVNMVPVPKQQGISNGYLRPAEGVQLLTTGPGIDRGGVNWRGLHYRVMGSKLVRIDVAGTIVELGDVDTGGLVSLDYSFDRLAIASNGKLFYWDGATLKQVVDPDLGIVKDVIWVDGYFMTTDGSYLVVTELNDPFSVLATKYGSSEVDPDPIMAIKKVRNEPHAINRYTIEAFDNVGGTGFPFRRIDGAQINRGSVGTKACCNYLGGLAILGGGRNEPISVWLASNGQTTKIATREIDRLLSNYSESTLSTVLVEPRTVDGHEWLYVHLPDQTLCYDAEASKVLGQHVWFVLSSGSGGVDQYRARNFVFVHDAWHVSDPQQPSIGTTTLKDAKHWGRDVAWEVSTPIIYAPPGGAIFHELELVCLSGRTEFGKDSMISTSYSLDGVTWSMERSINAGKTGQRTKRLIWLNQGATRNWRIQRFRGDSRARLSIARLEARVEALA